MLTTLRVRNLAAATEFYDALLGVLGATRDYTVNASTSTWHIDDHSAFGITEGPPMPFDPMLTFLAPSCGTVDAIATILPSIGARDIEMPARTDTGSYACFFSDPDGNRLSVCHAD